MKKMLGLLLALTLLAMPITTLGEGELPHFKIGVSVGNWDNKALMTQNYYDNYVGPAFNCEFIWAETITDTSATLSFIENLYLMGADGFIDYKPVQDSELDMVVNKCNEYGIVYVHNEAKTHPKYMNVPYYAGAGGADPVTVGEQFYEMTKAVLGDGEPHNIMLHSGLCTLGVAQHNLSGENILEALIELFGLSIEGDPYEIVTTTTSPTELETGTDMRVVLETSNPVDVDSFYNWMKDGEFDALIFTGPMYLNLETTAAEIEKTYGKNIRIISIAPVADTTYNSFATLDATGNQALDAALIKNNSAGGVLFAMMYNALTGHRDDMILNGEIPLYDAPMWVVYNLAEYEAVGQLDAIGGEYFTLRIEDLKNMIFEFNPELTAENFMSQTKEIGDLPLVMQRNGL